MRAFLSFFLILSGLCRFLSRILSVPLFPMHTKFSSFLSFYSNERNALLLFSLFSWMIACLYRKSMYVYRLRYSLKIQNPYWSAVRTHQNVPSQRKKKLAFCLSLSFHRITIEYQNVRAQCFAPLTSLKTNLEIRNSCWLMVLNFDYVLLVHFKRDYIAHRREYTKKCKY